MRHLSPELALVDEDLARDARAALPEARDVLGDIARHWESEPIRQLRAVLTADSAPERRRSRRPALYLLAGGLAGLSAVAGAAAALRSGPTDRAVPLPAVRVPPAVVRTEHRATVRSRHAKKASATPKPERVAPARPRAAVVRHVPTVGRPAPPKLSVAPHHAVPKSR